MLRQRETIITMEQLESQSGESNHWSENIWNELNSISDKRHSLERILSSKNIHSPTSESEFSSNKENKAPRGRNIIELSNQQGRKIVGNLSSSKRKNANNDQTSQNSILDWINSDISIASFRSFENDTNETMTTVIPSESLTKSNKLVPPVPERDASDSKSLNKRNKRHHLVSPSCKSQRKPHRSKSKILTGKYKQEYSGRHTQQKKDEMGLTLHDEEVGFVENCRSQKMNNVSADEELGPGESEQNDLYNVIHASDFNEKEKNKWKMASETLIEDRKGNGCVEDNGLR